ncbi:MAG: hypothetical protein L0G87_00580 [Renibacterium salmoninarum]|jgi:hypothetical protein|nr:hypothetical protein [Renibacterium salmoninarum]
MKPQDQTNSRPRLRDGVYPYLVTLLALAGLLVTVAPQQSPGAWSRPEMLDTELAALLSTISCAVIVLGLQELNRLGLFMITAPLGVLAAGTIVFRFAFYTNVTISSTASKAIGATPAISPTVDAAWLWPVLTFSCIIITFLTSWAICRHNDDARTNHEPENSSPTCALKHSTNQSTP